MAIIIPSKNIYGDIDNPKVAENAIAKIEISDTKAEILRTQQSNKRDELTVNSLGAETLSEYYEIIDNPQPPSNEAVGTWVFNDTLNLPQTTMTINVNFKSNGMDFTQITVDSNSVVFNNETQGIIAYSGTWKENLNQIQFESIQTIPDVAFEWLKANAVWQLMLLGGTKILSKHFNSRISIDRFVDNYYIDDVAPTLDIDYDVKISKVNATSIWGDTPTFDYYGESNTIQSGCRNLNYTHQHQIFNFKKNFRLLSSISILPEKISCNFSISIDEESISSFNVDRFSYLINTYYYSLIYPKKENDKIDFEIKAIDEMKVWVGYDYLESKRRGNFGKPAEAFLVELKMKKAQIVYNETIKYLKEEEKTEILSQSENLGEEVFSVAKNIFIKNGSASNAYNNTLGLYSSGKEIATLRCIVGEYYDENGKIAISTKSSDKMIFEHYDKVVPMVLGQNGQDVPMSINSIGEAKVFEVVGVSPIYDGAILQELTLREIF